MERIHTYYNRPSASIGIRFREISSAPGKGGGGTSEISTQLIANYKKKLAIDAQALGYTNVPVGEKDIKKAIRNNTPTEDYIKLNGKPTAKKPTKGEATALEAYITRANKAAEQLVGTKYSWGKMDCSGFVSTVLNSSGLAQGRYTSETMKGQINPGTTGPIEIMGWDAAWGKKHGYSNGHVVMKIGETYYEAVGGKIGKVRKLDKNPYPSYQYSGTPSAISGYLPSTGAQALAMSGGDPVQLDTSAYNIIGKAAQQGVSLNEGEAQFAIVKGWDAQQAIDFFKLNKALIPEERHAFETNIKGMYLEMLGVEPGKETLDYHMNIFKSGKPYNTNDVALFIKNSKQYQDRIANESIPTVMALYSDLLGISDISRVPTTYNYVLGKLKTGEWTDIDVKSFIMRSPQYKQRTQNLIAQDLRELVTTKYNVTNPDEVIDKYLMPKANAGWTDAQIGDWLRSTPDFQARYKGIREDESPDEYDNFIAQLNEIKQRTQGKAFDINDPNDFKVVQGKSALEEVPL